MIETDKSERYVSTEDTARMIKKAPGTLANDRFYRRGLPYIKIGGRVLYDIEDIHKYLSDRKIKHKD